MTASFTVRHVVEAPWLAALLTELIDELKGYRMDATQLQAALEAATTELKAAKASLDATNTVMGKVVNEETGLLVQIQTLTDLLAGQQSLPPEVVAAVGALNAAVADVKASAATVATSAGAADALVPDTPTA
ncbi:MAG TPA: hypothetical protein PLL72_03810 [Burkholderiaceae bacterium]|nr:hypothetical protein [Burkholderiaceae bacterium]